MKRRLDLAAALVHQPEVLFLDEPTTGLDPTSRAAVWDEVRRLNQQRGTTIFLTTQYLEEADSLADRVGIIAKGRIVAEGSPAELKRSIGSDVIVIKVDPADVSAVERVLAALPELGTVEHSGRGGDRGGSPRCTAISPVAVALADAGITVDWLTLRTPTLDDVFLHMMGERMGDDSP